jgi:hypothetical protein
MQDFDYRYFGTKHVTVELYPGYDYGAKNKPIDLAEQWANNRQSMLHYLEDGITLLQNYSGPSAATLASVKQAIALATATPSPQAVDRVLSDADTLYDDTDAALAVNLMPLVA